MKFSDLAAGILTSDPDEILRFLSTNQKRIKLLFLNANNDIETEEVVGRSFSTLYQKQFPEFVLVSECYQNLINQFSLFFKRTNNVSLLSACRYQTNDISFRNRIEAFILVHDYSGAEEHISRIGRYLDLITQSIFTDQDDISNEIVNDIIEYYHFAIDQLHTYYQNNRISDFIALFEDPDLLNQYPILYEVFAKLHHSYPDLPVDEIKDKVFEPSEFSQKLFDENIIQFIKNHPDTVWPDRPLGYDKQVIRHQILFTGLANFDEPYKQLTPKDKVKLYCFFNMRKHFFSSYSIFERIPNLVEMHESGARIKFIDIGCGPATSALAFLDYLYSTLNKSITFDYFGIDISIAMLDEAAIMLTNEAINDRSIIQLWADLKEIKINDLRNASCIIINTCYLFASTSLEVGGICNFVNSLRQNLVATPILLLFQNPNDQRKNAKYREFKRGLNSVDTRYSAVNTVYYNNSRGSTYPATGEVVYYELLKL